MDYSKSFYVVQGWMIHELGLSGTELDVFALIHGFTQDGNTPYIASNTFLEKFLKKSRSTIIKSRDSLLKKGYIERVVKEYKGQQTNHYMSSYCVGSSETLPPLEGGGTKIGLQVVRKSDYLGGAKKLPNNNKPYNNNNNNNIYVEKDPKNNPPYEQIIDYLNEKASSNFKHNSEATKRLIRARWAEGNRLDDFKKVIDNKTSDWINDDKMKKYLRPSTLFNASKFEGYLNEDKPRSANFPTRSYAKKDLDSLYDNLEDL